MCKEYNKRYGRVHAGEAICKWYFTQAVAPELLPIVKMTPFHQAMPDDCKNPNAVVAYRNYYNKYKVRFAKWAHSKTPKWFNV